MPPSGFLFGSVHLVWLPIVGIAKLPSSNFQTLVLLFITLEKHIFKMLSRNKNGFYLMDFYSAPGMLGTSYVYDPKLVQQPHKVNSIIPFDKFKNIELHKNVKLYSTELVGSSTWSQTKVCLTRKPVLFTTKYLVESPQPTGKMCAQLSPPAQ